MSDGPWWALRCCCGVVGDPDPCPCPLHVNTEADPASHAYCHVYPIVSVGAVDYDAVESGPEWCPLKTMRGGTFAGTFVTGFRFTGPNDYFNGCSWYLFSFPSSTFTDYLTVTVLANGDVHVSVGHNYPWTSHSMNYIAEGVFGGAPPWNFASAGEIEVPFSHVAHGGSYAPYLSNCDFSSIGPASVRFVIAGT